MSKEETAGRALTACPRVVLTTALAEKRTVADVPPRSTNSLSTAACSSIEMSIVRDCGQAYSWNSWSRIGHSAKTIPEKSAQKIFRAADQVLRAGRSDGSS